MGCGDFTNFKEVICDLKKLLLNIVGNTISTTIIYLRHKTGYIQQQILHN